MQLFFAVAWSQNFLECMPQAQTVQTSLIESYFLAHVLYFLHEYHLDVN